MKSVAAFVAVAALPLAAIFLPTEAHAQLAAPTPFGQPTQSPPGQPTSNAGGTLSRLNESEAEDSGRRLELFYVDAHVGGGFLAGPGGFGFFGAGGSVGVRLLTFTVGARVRDQIGTSNLLLVNGEAAYRLTFGSVDLFAGVNGGLAAVTNTGGGAGANVGGDVGLDWYLTPNISLGAVASPSAYFLKGSDPRFGLFGGAQLGLHFGL